MNLEVARKKLEYKKVETAKEELLFKILEREADIERLKDTVKAQDKRMQELEEIIDNLKKE